MTPAHDARDEEESDLLCKVLWRTGGSVGRSVYAVFGEGGHELAREDEAVLIGCLDSAGLAEEAVRCHNDHLTLGLKLSRCNDDG